MKLSTLASACALVLFWMPGCWRRETLAEHGARHQILHRGIGFELGDLDPHLSTQAVDYGILSALFEGLVSEDPVDLHPVPGVAERWEVSHDGRVYTFHLRPSARWSNGDPVTAVDFVRSIRRALHPELGAENAPALHVLEGAEDFARGRTKNSDTIGARALDDRTLQLTLERPCASFLARLNQPIWFPVHLPTLTRFGSPTRRGNPWARPGRCVSNGPFVLSEWRINQRITVTASPTYWDAAALRLRAISFYPLEIDAEERAFRAGQLHVTETLPPAKIGFYRERHPAALRVDPLLGVYFYRLNTVRGALRDPRVRRALSLAVDRRAIVERITQGGQSPALSFTPPGISGYVPPGVLKRDTAAARALLAEAGYGGGKGFSGLELVYASSELHRSIAEAVQEQWRRELGVEVRLTNMETTSVLSARRTGQYDVLRSSWIGDFLDAENFLQIWTSDNGNNFTGWRDADYDALLRKASDTLDAERRSSLLKSAEERLLAAVPCIPLFHYTHVYLVSPSVRGWHPTPLDHHPYKYVWLEP